MSGFKWSKKDDDFLRLNYKNMNNLEILKYLEGKRNASNVGYRLRKLGLSRLSISHSQFIHGGYLPKEYSLNWGYVSEIHAFLGR